MIVLLRHGQAVGNTEHRFIGWAPVPLDSLGIAQAEAVARRLATSGIERIVSSDLVRTVQTVEPLVRATGIEAELDTRFREIDNGEWTDLPPAEIADGWPELWHEYRRGHDVRRPQGERWVDVRARVVTAFSEYLADGRPTVVVTHGGPVLIATAWALGIDLPGNIFTGPLAVAANASITTIDDGKLIAYGDAGHLDGALRGSIAPYAPPRSETTRATDSSSRPSTPPSV